MLRFSRWFKPKTRKTAGFTIVELLVVIVVIGILAAITIVSYSSISQKAVTVSIQSDLSNAAISIKTFQVLNDNFPSTISIDCSASPDTSTNKCLKISAGNSIVGYSANNTVTPKTFLMILSNSVTVYKVTENTAPVQLANTTQPNITPGATIELHAAKANAGSGPGINSPITSTWTDTSFSNYNGTLSNFTGSPWGGTGTTVDPYKLTFDGTDDSVILSTVPSFASYPYSIEVWTTISALSRYQGFLRLHTNSNGIPVLAMWTNNRMLMYCGSEKYRYSSKLFASGDLNAPIHIVGTIAGPNTTDIHMYINGAINDGSTGNDSGSVNAPTVAPWVVGNTQSINLSGSIISLRVYPFALTSSQVTANYSAGVVW